MRKAAKPQRISLLNLSGNTPVLFQVTFVISVSTLHIFCYSNDIWCTNNQNNAYSYMYMYIKYSTYFYLLQLLVISHGMDILHNLLRKGIMLEPGIYSTFQVPHYFWFKISCDPCGNQSLFQCYSGHEKN